MRIRRPAVFLSSATLAVVGMGAVAGPATAANSVTYPAGTCQEAPGVVATTLQNCIDHVSPGTTVILTSQVIDEVAVIAQSLTLRGQDPSLHAQLRYITIEDGGGVSPVKVTLQDLVVAIGIRANYDQGAGHTLTIDRVEVGKGSSSARGIDVAAAVPVSVDVERSYARTTESQGRALRFYSTHSSGTSHFRAVGNRITTHGSTNSGSGIEVNLSQGGTTAVDIHNNSVWDVVQDNAGGASGIYLYPSGPVHVDANVVGNTVDRVGAGTTGSDAVFVRNSITSGGHLTVDVFDNVLSHVTGVGLAVSDDHPSTSTFRAGYNDYYANGVAPFSLDPGDSAGLGNHYANPRFVSRSTGDLRLSSASSLIDQGQACTSGGLANVDAAGHGRLAGSNVDMGAYERGSGAPTGVVRLGDSGSNTLTGTSGSDILCGYGGMDKLTGMGGTDYLDGGSGRDKLCGKDGVHGNDVLDGGSGTDSGQRDSGDTQVSVEHSTSC